MDANASPLSSLKGFPKRHLNKLAELNITTAEQFVSLANTGDKREKIARFLGLELDELTSLIELAKGSLTEDVIKEMEAPIDTTQYGLGALKPKPKK